MKKLLLSLIYSLLLIPILQAQTTNEIYYGYDIGFNIYNPSLSNPGAFRYTAVDYWDVDNVSSVSTSVSSFFCSLKTEKKLNDYFTFGTGLRYTSMNSRIGESDYYAGEYFYYRISSSSSVTNYYKLYNVKEVSYFLGLPLELKIFPYRASFVRLYFKGGMDFNIRLSTKQTVTFVDQEMKNYSSQILTDINGDRKNIFANTYGGIGLQFGKKGYPHVNVELFYAHPWLQASSAILNNETGFGMSFGMVFPLVANK